MFLKKKKKKKTLKAKAMKKILILHNCAIYTPF